MENLSWILVMVSLLGNFFVIKKNVIGQWLWTFGNMGWIAYDIYLEAYPQAVLFAVYLGMSIWGIYLWNKESKAKLATNN